MQRLLQVLHVRQAQLRLEVVEGAAHCNTRRVSRRQHTQRTANRATATLRPLTNTAKTSHSDRPRRPPSKTSHKDLPHRPPTKTSHEDLSQTPQTHPTKTARKDIPRKPHKHSKDLLQRPPTKTAHKDLSQTPKTPSTKTSRKDRPQIHPTILFRTFLHLQFVITAMLLLPPMYTCIYQ